MLKYAIIVAGGTGLRMGGPLPKQFMLLKGKPLLWYTINAFIEAYDDMQIILVLPELFIEKGKEIAVQFPYNRMRITTGGETRFHSVKNGLRLVDNHAIVLVHDGVRCLVTPRLIQRCCEETIEHGNAIPAVASVDSIRIEARPGNEVVDRSRVRIIQTPQTFFSEVIKEAFEQDYKESFTDEACVVERLGVKINLIEGESNNIKITRPIDLLIADKILSSEA
jgi:2-C-methyl-D-erythritol 4-phosphate cytidylyltransferase